jgi:hypothetical protein
MSRERDALLVLSLVINLKTAKALGLDVPCLSAARRRGDRVILVISASGTSETCGDDAWRSARCGIVLQNSADGGWPAIIESWGRAF